MVDKFLFSCIVVSSKVLYENFLTKRARSEKR